MCRINQPYHRFSIPAWSSNCSSACNRENSHLLSTVAVADSGANSTMAAPQQLRPSGMLVVAVTLAVLFVGSADAWYTRCSSGYADCNPRVRGCETCISKDPKNCGRCGNCCKQVANALTPCRNGKCCQPECKPGFGNCDHNIWKNGCEKSLLCDPFNCGACGKCCPQYPNTISTCKNGKCGPPVCKFGWDDCDSNISNGCEFNVLSDVGNCGKCGFCCGSYPNAITPCKNGKCRTPVCEPGWGNCDGNIETGCEKSLLDDVLNCGACGKCCPVTISGAEATCSAGKCGQQCKAGTQLDRGTNCCVPIPNY